MIPTAREVLLKMLRERYEPEDVVAAEAGRWCNVHLCGVDVMDAMEVFAKNANCSAVEEARREDRERLADPTFVHLNMLRGGIARPSIANVIHLYGEDAIRAALPDAPERDGGGE